MSEQADAEARTRFVFGPLDRRGLVAGWRGGQIGAVAVGLVVAVLVVRAFPSVPGVVGALAVVGAVVAGVSWPLAGRTAEQWAPDAVRFATSASSRRRRCSPFAGLSVFSVDDGNATAALVYDAPAGTYTAVLSASGSGFILLGADEQLTRVASWSSVLASLARAGSPVHRLQWVVRSFPDDGTAVRRHAEQQSSPAAPEAASRSYLRLLDSHSTATLVHETLLSVTVDARRCARAVRAAGGGHRGAAAVLVRSVAELRRLLNDAGISTSVPLDEGALASVFRRAFDEHPRRDGLPRRRSRARWPWPMGVAASWRTVRVDGTVHATYWVAEWPRTEVGPDFLGPLLVSDVRRTASVTMAPVDSLEAARRTEQARTADLADAELRRRGGFLATARRSREEQTLFRRERELADGHAQFRFAGYVTVTALDDVALEDACARTEQAAGRCGLELRRCFGDQDRAFAITLPLGRGLR